MDANTYPNIKASTISAAIDTVLKKTSTNVSAHFAATHANACTAFAFSIHTWNSLHRDTRCMLTAIRHVLVQRKSLDVV